MAERGSAAFWRGAQRGSVYGMALSVIGFAVFSVVFAPFFLVYVAVGTLLLLWMAYTLGRQDQQEAEIRRRARQLQEHPDWPVCEMHRRG